MRIEVVGVYPVAAAERCHLIELLIAEAEPAAHAVESITQEAAGQSRDNWQVAYDEHYLTSDGERQCEPASAGEARVAFFFHHLDFRRPLLTAAGPVPLPPPSPRPSRLDFIDYEGP